MCVILTVEAKAKRLRNHVCETPFFANFRVVKFRRRDSAVGEVLYTDITFIDTHFATMPMVGGFGDAKPADEDVAAVLSHAAVAKAIKNAAGPGDVTPFSYKTQVVRS